jgi:hypothetical protein
MPSCSCSRCHLYLAYSQDELSSDFVENSLLTPYVISFVMGFLNYTLVFAFLLLASFCCAAPAKQPITLSTTLTTNSKATALTVGPKSTPSLQSSAPQSISSSNATATAPPVLLSQATADKAGGGVPSGLLPETSFTPNAVQLFKVANFIENIESAFFAQVLQSLGKDQTFNAPARDGRSIANVTSQIAAQELVHIATVGGLLGAAGEQSVPACANIVGVSDTNDFLAKSNGTLMPIFRETLRSWNDRLLKYTLKHILTFSN